MQVAAERTIPNDSTDICGAEESADGQAIDHESFYLVESE